MALAHTLRSFLVVGALTATIAAVAPDDRTAHAAPMSLVPDATWLALITDADQVTTPDPQCAAVCASERDRLVGAADKTRSAQGYFSKFSSNCTEDTGQPKCAALRQACWDACAPKFDNACMARCELPFQNCCHTNAVSWAENNYNVCIARCPTAKGAAPSTIAPPPPTPPPAPKPIDREAAWKSMANSAASMLQALGGMRLDGLTNERFDALRRELAFAQVSADMMARNAEYGVLAGGNGRLWAVASGGRRVLLTFPTPTGDEWADQTALERSVKLQTGLEGFQVAYLLKTIQDARERKDLAPGSYYLCRYFDNTSASSEHSSIRGTINGGGDFI